MFSLHSFTPSLSCMLSVFLQYKILVFSRLNPWDISQSVYITLSAKVDIIDCYSKPHLFFTLLQWAGEDLSLICLYSNSSGRVIQKMRTHWLESFDLTGI